jgi:hypothetical protein
MGQPTKYDPKYCQMLIDHMALGQSFFSFGAQINVGRRTLYDWLEVHDDFEEAKQQGELKSLDYWERIGINGMRGKIKGFNPTVWIFVSKCRFRQYGYRDYEPEEDPRKIDKADQVAKLMAHLTQMVEDKQCQPVQTYSSPLLVESPQPGLLGESCEPK